VTAPPDAEIRLLLVGGGRMGGALLAGLRRARFPVEVLVVDPSPDDGLEPRVAGLADVGGFRPDVVVVAVKPALAATVVPALRRLVDGQTVVLSFMAGVRLARLREWLGDGPALLRAMPNLAMGVGAGVCGVHGPTGAPNSPTARAVALLASCAEVVPVAREEDLDAVTAISGSGPAYVFRFVETLAAAALAQGLAPEVGMRLARKTVIGAALQLASDDRPASALREGVTSPGGTTARALDVLDRPGGLDDLLGQAVATAAAQSRAFADEI
jgi:pyrroline-5-carboxylate reductase